MPQGEGIDPVLLFFGTAQLVMSLGILTAWFFKPLYGFTTPIYSISLMPWGIVVRAPGVSETLGVGVVHLILWLLIATVILSAIAYPIKGAPRFFLYFASFLTTAFAFYILENTMLFMINIENQVINLVRNDTQLLISTGKLVTINGQEAVLLPMHTVESLTFTLAWLMAVSIINNLLSLTTRH